MSKDANKNLIKYATSGNLNGVRESLKNGTDVHANDDAALRSSAGHGHTKIVALLLEHYANVHANDDAALQLSAEHGHAQVVALLLKHDANVHANDDNALRASASNGQIKTLRILLEHGANVHAQDDAALRWGTRGGHIKIIKTLLQCGANANAYDNAALILAIMYCKVEIVVALLEHGANANANIYTITESNATVLTIAVRDYLGITFSRVVRERGRLKMITNNIINDIKNDYLKIIAVLLEHGADIYVKDGHILKQIYNNAGIPERLRKEFHKDLADVILPYCQSDDYYHFPDAYIKENIAATKNSNNVAT